MAGLLAYAAEGGLAGAGKGLEQAGGEMLKDQMQQGLMRLQNDYATQRQQAGFSHEEAMQGKQQGFEKGLKEEELGVSVASAKAAREQRESEFTRGEEGKTARTKITAQSRVDVANIRGASAAAGKNGPKPWQFKTVNVADYSKGYAVTTSKPLMFNPNTNSLYAQVGDKLVRWDSDANKPAYDPKVLNRKVDPGEVSRLYADPNGIIPSGYAGSGMTNLENFERLHHYLPSGIQARVMQGGMVNNNNPDAVGNTDTNSADDQNADADAAAQEAEDNAPAKEP
jgi:hypothetical protein